MLSFSELWEKCEGLHKESSKDDDNLSIIDELLMKIKLYKTLDKKDGIFNDELEKAKSRIVGEILLTLTNLSLKDNINVYEALSIAMQYKNAIKKH